LGIVIGSGNTAVAPTDYALSSRYGHGRSGVDGADVSLGGVLEGDTLDAIGVYYTTYGIICCRPHRRFQLKSIKVKAYRTGAIGNVVCGVYKMDLSGAISGAAITTSTVDCSGLTTVSPGSWVEFTLGASVEMDKGAFYYIRFDQGPNDSSKKFIMRGKATTSQNYGMAFPNGSANQILVDLWGRSQGEFEYSSCEVLPVVSASPNVTFDIRRYFTNNSGGALTVNEVGLQAVMANTTNLLRAPILIARDVVSPGVAVANTEILKVTYTPSITI
jgi:hypothetical protein